MSAREYGMLLSWTMLALLVSVAGPLPAQEPRDETMAESGDAEDERRSSRRRPRTTATANLTLRGEEIGITYPLLKRESSDYERLTGLADGEVFTFVGGATIKLKTEPSLRFGDVVIETHNAAETYPGVYGLWLQRTGDEWLLVFNEQADVWGTQHFDDGDVAEVPIVRSEADEEADTFVVELIEAGDSAAIVRMAWGPHQWVAPFELAQ